MQLLKTTLPLLRLPEDWQYEAAAGEGVMIVDVDGAEGKRLWRELLTKGRFYRVVPLTRDEQLRQFAHGLAKPLRSKPLEDLLRAIGAEMSSLQDELSSDPQAGADQLLLSEAMVQSPHHRYSVHLPDGHWFYVERDKDRVYATGGLDNLLASLFQPLRSIAIKPLQLRPESLVSGPASESYSLSLLLWSAAQASDEALRLKVLRGDRYFAVHHPMPWSKLPHRADQKVLLDYLKANGPLDLVSLILEVGMSPQQVMAFMAGAWLLGAVKAVSAAPGGSRAGQR